jgi:hypothetical protein
MSRRSHAWRVAVAAAAVVTCVGAQDGTAVPPSQNPFNRPEFMLALRPAAENPLGAPPAALKLKATLVTNGLTLANIDGEILAVGQTYAGYRIAAIAEGRAVLVRDGERLVLDVFEQQTATDGAHDE